MTKRIPERSPRSVARMAGVFQALEGTTATYGQVIVLGKLSVHGNAAVTAANIFGHKPLFRIFGHRSCMPSRLGASSL